MSAWTFDGAVSTVLPLGHAKAVVQPWGGRGRFDARVPVLGPVLAFVRVTGLPSREAAHEAAESLAGELGWRMDHV